MAQARRRILKHRKLLATLPLSLFERGHCDRVILARARRKSSAQRLIPTFLTKLQLQLQRVQQGFLSILGHRAPPRVHLDSSLFVEQRSDPGHRTVRAFPNEATAAGAEGPSGVLNRRHHTSYGLAGRHACDFGPSAHAVAYERVWRAPSYQAMSPRASIVTATRDCYFGFLNGISCGTPGSALTSGSSL